MKFTEAWAGVAQENIVLKCTVAGLVISNVITAFALTAFALKKPLIVERDKQTKIASLGNAAASELEVDRFVRQTLFQRFNSGASLNENFFVVGEIRNHAAEMKELKSRHMKQKVIVNRVDVSKEQIAVDADRIIKVGEVKTILSFPLRVKLASIDRTIHNPYGLKIAEITKVKKRVDKNEK